MSFVRNGTAFGSLRALLVLVLLGIQFTALKAGEVTLAWDYNSDDATTGYNVYVISGGVTGKVNVGNTNITVVSNLIDGVTYSFFATAYNADGLESEPSEQLTYPSGSVVEAPVIVTGPVSQQASPGSAVTFSVTASGTGPLSYQWFKDGVAVTGATGEQLNIGSVQASDAGSYSVQASNSAGSVSSGSASLSLAIIAAPSILSQPVSSVAAAGGVASFSVSVSGIGPMSYQWFKDGSLLSGATGATLTISGISAGNAGSYSVRVSNAGGFVVSAPATLSLIATPVITMQPISQSVNAGAPAQFVIQASGTGPLSYQWYKDGLPISGATSFLLAIPNAQSANAGSYYVNVSSGTAKIQSAVAVLSVTSQGTQGPKITTAPLNRTVFEGSGVSFSVQATGTGTLKYEWFKDGQLVLSGPSPIYSIIRTKNSDAGNYQVVVTDSTGSTTASPVKLIVISAPIITDQPASLTSNSGDSLNFSVSATGSGTLSYQWVKDGVEISGATSSTYAIASANLTDAGNYTVRVSNTAGSVSSQPASLTVNTAPTVVSQPASQVVNEGSAVSFSVKATGSGTLSYQWAKNGVDIAGATSAAYAIASVSESDTGDYTVRVSNTAGSVTSQSATLAVNTAPTLVSQPASQVVNEGSVASFSVSATGSGTLSYQWVKDGVEISGATSSTYTIASANLTDAGNYTVRVSNTAGNITSQAASLTVNTAPTIVSQPVSQVVNEGSVASFSVKATGSGTLSYQWAKNGVDIVGATSAAYSIASVSESDAGDYTVRVTNTAGSVTSRSATLAVNTAPTLVSQPASQVVNEGSVASFSVKATGSGTLSYQWAKNGVDIGGATSAAYAIASVSESDAGDYTVRVSNMAGSITSQAASLTVNTAPQIIAQSPNRLVNEGAEVSISLVAKGSGTLSYQWYKDGNALAGATAANLTLSQATPEDAGVYTATVANDVGEARSVGMMLTVLAAPRIVAQPISQSSVVGASIFLNVQATGAAPLSYQWLKDGVVVPGANSAYYLVSSADITDAGSYAVKVSNSVSNVTSSAALLTIIAPPVITTQPASVRVNLGQSAKFSVGAVAETTLAFQWFKDAQPISGATSSEFLIAQTRSEDAGKYHVQVSNQAGATLSSAATLSFGSVEKPLLGSQPQSQTVSAGSEVRLSVLSSGTDIQYQWYKDGAHIVGATNSMYFIPSADKTDTGVYFVELSNSAGSAKSDNATLIVVRPPTIITHPSNVVTVEGATFNLFTAATGTAPFQYQWYLNGSPIPSATNNALTVSSAVLGNAGLYSVIISNSAGTVESQAALVSLDSRNSEDRGSATIGGGLGGNPVGIELSPARIELPLIGTSMLLQGVGTPGAWYDLEYTSNLGSGVWVPITTVVADQDGSFEMISNLGTGNYIYRAVARFE